MSKLMALCVSQSVCIKEASLWCKDGWAGILTAVWPLIEFYGLDKVNLVLKTGIAC